MRRRAIRRNDLHRHRNNGRSDSCSSHQTYSENLAMPYRYICEFDKVFVSGCLEGKTIRDSLHFADWQSAEHFRVTRNNSGVIKPCAGSDEYFIENIILTAI
jgi:hypothetical protein